MIRAVLPTALFLTLILAACGSDGSGGDPACSPDTCAGCCDGDLCRPGLSDAACGVGGAACVACAGDQLCGDAAACVPACTPATCETLAAACGTLDDGCGGALDCGDCGNDAVCNAQHLCEASFSAGTDCTAEPTGCQDGLVCVFSHGGTGACFPPCESYKECGSGEGCFTGGDETLQDTVTACTPLPAESDLFHVLPAVALVPEVPPAGGQWDADGTAPDLYVEVCAAGACATTQIIEDLAPMWGNEYLGPWTHAELGDATVTLWDHEGAGAPQLVASWQGPLTSAWAGQPMSRVLEDPAGALQVFTTPYVP